MADIAIERNSTGLPEVNLPVVDWKRRTFKKEEAKESEDDQLQIVQEQQETPDATPLIAEYLKGNEKGELTKGDVVDNKNFIGSARRFLKVREPGIYSTNEDVFDAFMNHFRHQDVNELTAIHDLEYAWDATGQQKQDLFDLMTAYDKMTGEAGTLDFFGDYAGGLVRAPSTWLGLFTGGGGKLGAVAAQKGIQLTIKQVLKAAIKKARIPAAIEGAAGGVQGASVSEVRKEIGMESDTPLATIVGVAGGAIPGFLIGGTTSAIAIKRGQKLGKRLLEGEQKLAAQLDTITVDAKKVMDSNTEFKDEFLNRLVITAERKAAAEAAKAGGKAPPLDPKAVETGMKTKRGEEPIDPDQLELDILVEGDRYEKGYLKGALVDGETDFLLTLGSSAIKRVTAAAHDMLKAAKIDPTVIKDENKRVTQLIYDAIVKRDAEGKLVNEGLLTEIDKIAARYKLTSDEFAAVFIADASEAGRILGAFGHLSRQLDAGKISRSKYDKYIGKLETDYDRFTRGLTRILPDSAKKFLDDNKNLIDVGKAGQAAWSWARNIDIARRGFMVIQPKTTLRNMANAGMRVPMYMLDNILAGRGGPEGIIDTLKLPFDFITRGEADAFAHVFQKGNQKQYQRLFRSAMDLNVEVGAGKWSQGSVIGSMARKMNVLNTTIDNGIKRTIFFNEVKLAVGGSSKLKKLMDDGSLNDWLASNPNAMAKAIDEALAFTYQKSYAKGSIAGRLIEQSSNPLFTAFIPFPRFLVNQTQFVYEHMPLLSLAVGGVKAITDTPTTLPFRERLAKQITGSALMYGALQLRSLEGPYVPWNQVTDPDGNRKDVTALLGPFAPTFFVTDLLNRVSSGGRGSESLDKYAFPLMDANQFQEYDYHKINWRDAAKALTGMQVKGGFNTGMNIVDELGEMLQNLLSTDPGSKSEYAQIDRIWNRLEANYVRSFTVPVGMIKDVVGTFDPEGRDLYDNDNFDLYKMWWKRALASFPASKTLPEGTARDFLEEKRGVEQDDATIEELAEGDIRRPLRIPESGRNVKSTDTLFATFTGATSMQTYTRLQEELVFLRMSPTDFYQKDKDVDRNYFKKFFTGQLAELYLIPEFDSDFYRQLSPKEKRAHLFASEGPNWVGKIRTEANSLADGMLDRIKLYAKNKEEFVSTAKDRAEYNRLSKRSRDVIEEHFQRQPDLKKLGDIHEDNLYRMALNYYDGLKDGLLLKSAPAFEHEGRTFEPAPDFVPMGE